MFVSPRSSYPVFSAKTLRLGGFKCRAGGSTRLCPALEERVNFHICGMMCSYSLPARCDPQVIVMLANKSLGGCLGDGSSI